MLGLNFHIHVYHRKLKDNKHKILKTIPYLPTCTLKLKNKLETDLFFSRPKSPGLTTLCFQFVSVVAATVPA